MDYTVVIVVLCLLSVATLTEGIVYGWGNNNYGQLGLGNTTMINTPTSIPYYASIPMLSILTAADYHIALAQNGSAFGSGLEFYGQFANGVTDAQYNTPVLCPSLNSSLSISLGGPSCNALMNTKLLGWGNIAGYVEGKTSGLFPIVLTALASYNFDGKVTSVNSVMNGVLITLANGQVWIAGTNTAGQLGITNTSTQYEFVQATFWTLNNVSVREIFSSQSQHACALATNNSLYCWGANSLGQLGIGNTNSQSLPTLVSFFDIGGYYIYKVYYGNTFTVVHTCGGRVFTFGSNSNGELGQGNVDGSAHPNPAQVLINMEVGTAVITTPAVAVVAGYAQVFVRTNNSKWWVWGASQVGSIGFASANPAGLPTEAPTNSFFASINTIAGSSQTTNFFGWNDVNVNNDLVGCPTLVDECLLGTAKCAQNAICTDTERAYTCACNNGYVGNGYVTGFISASITGTGCQTNNSCATTCAANATCVINTTVTCTCPEGYQGDGTLAGGCAPYPDVCQGDPCADYAYCTFFNMTGDYNCTCVDDFSGDPYYAGCTLTCFPGEYSVNATTCDTCPPGTYTGTINAQYCTPCPAGTYNNNAGGNSSSACMQCPTGGYSQPSASFCSLCILGYTNNPAVLHSDNTTCTACPMGTYGYYGVCKPCPSGQYSNISAAAQCFNCPPGYSASESIECYVCPAGTRSSGCALNCTTCAAGYYSLAGSTDCQKCPVGTSTNGLTGQSTCSNCTAGFYNSKDAASTCSSCPAGTYSSTAGSSNCQQCTPGTFASSTGSTSCTACPTGTYAASAGTVTCSKCASGYSSASGLSCIPCAAGNYYNAVTRACTACPAGTFVAVAGASACYACPMGYYTASSGSAYCLSCGLNTYTNQTTGYEACEACPSGTTSPGAAYICS